jgi:hypothetical protein
MSGRPDHDRAKARPFLILADGAEGYRLLVRETRYNSQNYPIVTSTEVAERFGTVAAARAYARREFGAAAGEFALK